MAIPEVEFGALFLISSIRRSEGSRQTLVYYSLLLPTCLPTSSRRGVQVLSSLLPLYLFSQCPPQTLSPEMRNKPCSSWLSGIHPSSGLFHLCFNNSAPPNLYKPQNSSLFSLLLVYFEQCFTWIFLSLSSRLWGSMQYPSQCPLKQAILDRVLITGP